MTDCISTTDAKIWILVTTARAVLTIVHVGTTGTWYWSCVSLDTVTLEPRFTSTYETTILVNAICVVISVTVVIASLAFNDICALLYVSE